MVPHPSFERFMKLYCVKEFRHFLPLAYASESLQKTNDPWWQFRDAITELNNNRKQKIHFPPWVANDESMSAWTPWTTNMEIFPTYLSLPGNQSLWSESWFAVVIFTCCCSNLLLLVLAAAIGTEFKCVACSITGTMLHPEIQEGREGMKDKRLNKDLGTTSGCTVRLMAACSTSTGIKGDAWFGSITAASDTIKKPFFAMTSNAGSTEPGQPYEMKYMDPFGNVKTWLVNCPAVLSEFFLDSNTIDYHNQSQQHDLSLGKCWHS